MMNLLNNQIFVRPLVMILFVLGVFQTSVLAQSISGEEVTVEVELSRSSVYVGDELAYKVIVRGARDPQPPEVEFPNSVRAQFHGRSSQSFTSMRIVNGVRRSVTERSYIFQYTLTAMREGSVEIPAPSVMADGEQLLGKPARFESLLPVLSEEDKMHIRLDRTRLYLNETVEVECVWWIAANTSEFNLASSSIPDTFEIRPSQPSTGGQYKIDFALDGQSLSGYVETGIHNGREMSRFSFKFSITPTETGQFVLGPMRSIFTRHSGTGNRFRAYVESNSIPIEVVPVPSEGRPTNYAGAIGPYQLIARASNTTVNVGDPIQLTLRIRGDEPMVGVSNAPELMTIPAFKDQFKIDSDGWREVAPRNPGTRLYETTIRALNSQVRQIPSIEFPSFIPETGSYTIFKTEPIPLDVSSVYEVTLSDAVINSSNDAPRLQQVERVDRIELTAAAPGLWAHGTAQEVLEHPGFNLANALAHPGWQSALIAPPVFFFSAWACSAYIRTRNPVRVRLQRAYASARRQAGTQSLRTYIALAQQIEPNAVTASDALELPIEPDLRSQLYTVLIDRESGLPVRSEPDTASTLLRAVHTSYLLHIEGNAA